MFGGSVATHDEMASLHKRRLLRRPSAVAIDVVLVSPPGAVDAPGHRDHRALGDGLSDAPAGSVEAGDPVPLGLGLASTLAVREAARGGEREVDDLRSRLGFAGLRIVGDESDGGRQ